MRQAELICGIDEAGRGPLAGPVCAAAVILPDDFPVHLLNDSKKLSPSRRQTAYALITERAVDWAIGWATHDEIGELNILGASLLAMRRAFAALGLPARTVFVDGNRDPGLSGARAIPVVRGDATIPCVMAASILAKVARDEVMLRLDSVQPEYGFAKHKGYPTAEHRTAIKKAGPSLWARPGFRC